MKIEEFISKMDSFIKEYPEESKKALRKEANAMRKELVDASPVGRGKKKKISKSWKMSMKGSTDTTQEATIRNTSPHYHLVERGHVMRHPSGKVYGYKQGTYFFKNTVDKRQDSFTENIAENLFKQLKGKL